MVPFFLTSNRLSFIIITMKQYHDLLNDILNNGEHRDDRTGVGTISVFARQLRFDLCDSFPAITTKKLAWRAVVSELLWFLEGSNDERRLAEILHGTRDRVSVTEELIDGEIVKTEKPLNTIWTGNAEAEYWTPKAKFAGDLGVVYGNMWRKWPADPNNISTIPRKPKENDSQISYSPILEECVLSDDLTGRILENSSGHKFRVLENIGTFSGNSHYKIQFINTGYIDVVSRPNILNKCHRDWFEKLQSGVGVYGQKPKRKLSKLEKRIYSLWDNMISRCYDSNHPQYKFYGGQGVTVSTEWQNFSKFEHSIKSVPGFYDWCDDSKYELDKDYYGANQYSKSTTIFIHKKYNQELSRKKFKESEDLLERRIFYIDQVQRLIDGLRTDPMGRRHIISAWNVAEMDQMALPPCHVMSQFYVNSRNELSCHMYQRSVDVFLGLPFNIASYALLTHMIARHLGMGVGELIISTGDTHIYQDHVEQVKEQLAREEFPAPKLWLNPEVTDLFKFTMDDIRLDGYQSHGTIKAKMAV